MPDNMELKAYKALADIYSRFISQARGLAHRTIVYSPDNREALLKVLEHIAQPEEWDYCGLMCAADKSKMEFIEYLLNDESQEIHPYKNWSRIK